MELKGSCHCEKVSFTAWSHTPAPFMRCYCSICRKCQGGGGYSINIMAMHDTLKITGKEHLRSYQAMKDKKAKILGGNVRYFCGECGSHLYAHSKEWAEYIYPFASAIDSPLPELKPEDLVKIMLDSKANWVSVTKEGHVFKEYPDCSIEDWHRQNKKYLG
ncbi:Mss4-like protein [Pilobolus umbonatus]|nr:Mss4-like protein [Pilobolus umbonatus]